METLRSKSDEKKMVWSGYGHKALKIVRTKFRGRLVRMRSAVQIRPAAPKILENFGFRGFFVANSCFAVWVKKSDPHRDPHAETAGKDKRAPDGKICLPARFFVAVLSYMTWPRTLPMVWAASSCFCRVAWV